MDKRKTNHPEAIRLYKAGLSLQDVAEFYGITRQAMWAWLKKRKVKMRSHLRYGPKNNFYQGGRKSNKRVNLIVEKAIAKGILVRPILCERCQKPSVFTNGRTGIEAHHEDYQKPLDVMWLCHKCHYRLHAKRKSASTA